MLPLIEVAGDPRAMGRAQGEACREDIARALSAAGIARRERLPSSLRPFISGPVLGRGMALQIVRHYPHLSERIQGLARGAGQSAASLMELFVGAAGGAGVEPLVEPVAGAGRDGDTALLLRGVATADWIVRRSKPEVGFPSVELSLPWMATSLAGVNERGVAVLVAPSRAPEPGARAPSVLLLVQECLQRFHDVPGCLDWCSKRPASGAASIVVADASGEVAAIEVDGDVRRPLEAERGVLLTGGAASSHPELRKSLESPASTEALAVEAGGRLVLSPHERKLWVAFDPGLKVESFSVS